MRQAGRWSLAVGGTWHKGNLDLGLLSDEDQVNHAVAEETACRASDLTRST